MARVLVATSIHHPDDPRITHKTVPTLSRRHAVRLATRRPGPTDRAEVEWCPLDGSRPLRAVRALREMLRRDVDLVSIHDPELIPAAVLARMLRGVPVVFDVHEDYLGREVERGGGAAAPMWRARVALVRWLLDLAEGQLVLTLAEPSYARRFRGHHPVIANHPMPGSLPSPRPPAQSGPVVYVGELTAARGMHVLIRAVGLLADPPPLVLVGRCRRRLARTLAAQARDHGVELVLTGWLPHRRAMGVAAAAGVAVSPLLNTANHRHSLPTKVLEYLGVGVPLVASDLPGTAAVVAGLPGVHLVAPGDPWALAEGLRRAADPQVRAATVANVEDLLHTFRWPCQQLLDLYDVVISGGRRRGPFTVRRATPPSPSSRA